MITLIGFTGAGKSSIGRILALRYGFLIWDLDHLIAIQEGIPITEIFAVKGEDYFREIEAVMLASLLKHQGILVTGGGAVMRAQSRELLLKHSFVVHIHSTLDVIVQRLQNDTSRPLLLGRDLNIALADLYEKREQAYDFAHMLVDSSDLEQSADRIVGSWLDCHRGHLI